MVEEIIGGLEIGEEKLSERVFIGAPKRGPSHPVNIQNLEKVLADSGP